VTIGASIGAGVATVLTMGAASPLLVATLAGGAAGFTSGVLGTALHGGNFGQCVGAGLVQGLIGGAAGLAGAGIGGGVNSLLAGQSFSAGLTGTAKVVATGFCSGFVTGLAGGFTGGFVAGFASAAISGDDFGKMLNKGLTCGLGGAALGGAVGGILGGIDASIHGRDFWTGAPKQWGIFSITNGGVKFIDQNIYDRYTDDYTQGQYDTQIQENNYIHISDNQDGGETVEIRIPGADGVYPKASTSFQIYSQSFRNNVLTLQSYISFDGSQITIPGFRYYSNPINSISNLFYSRL